MIWLEFFLCIVAILLTLPGNIEIILLTLGAFIPRRKKTKSTGAEPELKTIVIVPAYNEEKVIQETLSALKQCTGHFDTVVICDNCTDATAEIVKKNNIRVISRINKKRKGKSHSLHEAFTLYLDKNYDIFIVIDADGLPSKNTITEIQKAFSEGSTAVQIRDAVHNPEESLRCRLMNVAFMAYNHLRSKGRNGLGLSAGIHGNGFALSKEVLQYVPYTVESLVEDIAYHLELVKSGYRVDYLDSCCVSSKMPTGAAEAEGQRARWEGGRFRLMIDKSPTLVKEIMKGRFRLIEPLLDLISLPLAYHCALLLLLLFAPFFYVKVYGLLSLIFVSVYLCTAIYSGGGSYADFLILFTAPAYLAWKLLIFFKIVEKSGTNASWDRTKRE